MKDFCPQQPPFFHFFLFPIFLYYFLVLAFWLKLKQFSFSFLLLWLATCNLHIITKSKVGLVIFKPHLIHEYS